MSDENQAQADAADATQTVADPLDAVISQDGTKIALNDYQAELEAAMNQPLNDEQGGEPADEPEQEQADEPEEQEQTSEEEEPEPEASEEEDTRLQERFRFKNDDDKAVAALAKAKGISLVEAAQQYAALGKPKEQTTESTNAEAPETSQSVSARIKELEAQAKEAATALNFDEAEDFRALANDLRDKLIDLKLSEREAAKEAESKQEREFYTKYEASEQKTLQFYPDAGKADSQLAKEMAALDAQMKELGDPLYYSENKPFILAQQAAVKLGIPMTKPGTATKPASKSVQHRPMQPASGNARTTTTDATKQLSEAIDGVNTVAEYEKLVAQMTR